ncbi:MAG: hypothetical protein CBB97_21350 [Candidatus Endolissoclinum sp. TMED37]|nr:MAG: hypothetical protein CBB97_21350 [Candidatus Endolissoclinum sp. TMED37]
MAVQTRMISRRDSIGDAWVVDRDQWLGAGYDFNISTQGALQELIQGGSNSYDGTFSIETSPDGLTKTLIASFSTQEDHDNFYTWAETNHSVVTIQTWLAENYPVGGTATASVELFVSEVV